MLFSHRLPCKRPVKLKYLEIFITFLCDLLYFTSENLFTYNLQNVSQLHLKNQKNRQTWVSQVQFFLSELNLREVSEEASPAFYFTEEMLHLVYNSNLWELKL